MNIRVINKSKHNLTEYAIKNSAGMDLRTNLESNVILKPMFFSRHEKAECESIENLMDSSRGIGGFGNKGKK